MGNILWKDIPDYEGKYQASIYGQIRSLRFTKTCNGYPKIKLLKICRNNVNGYGYVSLFKDGKKKSYRVHCLVMQVFNPVVKKFGYDKNYTINHKDGNKLNNGLDNLEWCTQSENQLHAYKTGLNPINPNKKKVIRLDDNKIYSSLTECASDNGARSVGYITRVCKGERSNYNNRHFAYYEDYINNTIPKYKGKYIKNGGIKWEP